MHGTVGYGGGTAGGAVSYEDARAQANVPRPASSCEPRISVAPGVPRLEEGSRGFGEERETRQRV